MARDRQGRRRSRQARGRREGLADPQPDAVLRRSRAARSATSARSPAPASAPPSTTRARNSATSSSTTSRSSRASARVGMAVELAVDHAARAATRANHSATHILHEALRHGARRPRRAKGLARLARAAALRLRPSQADHAATNSSRSRTSPTAWCCENAEVTTRLMGLDERASRARGRCSARNTATKCASSAWARSRTPRRASAPIRSNSAAAPMSRRTGDIGLIAIVGESAVAAGVRRIEAQDPRRGAQEAQRRIRAPRRSRRAPARAGRRGGRAPREPDRRQAQARARARRRQAQAGDGRRRRRRPTPCATSPASSSIARAVTGVDMKDLKSLADEAKPTIGSGVVAIAATGEDGKASLVVAVTPDLTTPLQRGRSGAARLCGARRQGRRRAAGHGAGRRTRRRQAAQALAAVEDGDSRRAGASREGGSMSTAILDELKAYEPELIEIRRDIHRHPETGFEDPRTAGLVAEKLRAWGVDVVEGVGQTGVVGTFKGERPASARSACAPIWTRCTSRRAPGARLSLDRARQDARLRPRRPHRDAARRGALPGRASAISPARCTSSSSPPRRASAAARRWSRRACSSVFPSTPSTACTTRPGCPVGKFATRKGPFMAASDTWTVMFRGTGGHGGAGAHLATDTTLAPRPIRHGAADHRQPQRRPRARPRSSASAMSRGGDYDAPNIIPPDGWSCAARRDPTSRRSAI